MDRYGPLWDRYGPPWGSAMDRYGDRYGDSHELPRFSSASSDSVTTVWGVRLRPQNQQ